jgi:cell division protein ZapA
MEEPSRLVTVDINGQRYPIRTQLDSVYVADLAAYVEQKMLLAARESPGGDSLKIAVLAALNIADEYFHARENSQAQKTDLTARAQELERMLDLALAAPAVQERVDTPLARTAGSH